MAGALWECETIVMPPATPEGMVGVWEALIPDGGSMQTGVLQMVVSPQGDAKLIEMYALIGGGVLSKFFGTSTSIQLHDGKFTARFFLLTRINSIGPIGSRFRDRLRWTEISAGLVVK